MLLEAEQLEKRYGKELALAGVDVAIAKGELVAYLGTNGAGKSTTIGILTGLLAPTAGEIIRQDGLKIGIVFQQSILDKELSVRDNLFSRKGLYRRVDEAWFSQLLDLFDLDDLLSKPYGQLSGGQKRRVDIARALINQPDILFLDEPTTGLDIQTRQMVWEILEQLRQQGLTIFLTTHYLEEADQADRIYVLENGRVLAVGSSQDLLDRYGQNALILTSSSLTQQDLPQADCLPNGQFKLQPIETAEVLNILATYKEDISDFAYHKADLNSVFLTITGKEL